MANQFLRRASAKRWMAFAALLTVALFSFQPLTFAQSVTGALSGTVVDTTGAVVPDAQVTLVDEATGTALNTKSNGAGQFSFPVLQPGTYDLRVAATGFSSLEQKGITLATKERRAVNVTLKVGAAAEHIEVQAGAEPVPLTTGASSTTLNNIVVSQTPIVGRDAAELIRLMPGMAINSGLTNTQWNSAVTQINSGPIGQFSANGTQPNGSMQLIMNGSVITDSGNQGTQIANVNQDMTDEVTFQNGSFDAEHAHGPVTFESVGKRGTRDIHGEAYAYTRNGSLNSNNSYLNASHVDKPIDHYWYTGGNIGGPIVFPGFNKNHDKAFFFTAFEHKKQNPAGALHQYFIPTPAMINGDFTQSTLAPYTGFSNTGSIPCADVTTWNGAYCNDAVKNGLITLYDKSGNPINGAAYVLNPNPANVSGSKISPGIIDPNGQILMKLLAGAPGLQMVNPATHNGYNAQYLDRPPFDGNEFNFKIDYNLGSKNKIFGAFTRQTETDINNLGLWWWTPQSVPYPSQMPANQVSRTWSVGVTTTLSNAMVNEASFGYAYFINPVGLKDPKAADPATYGYNVKTPFAQPVPQVPDIVSWCCNGGSGGGASNSASSSAGFGVGSFGANPTWKGNFSGKDSYTPDFSEKFTWMKGKHTLKLGFFWAQYANVQTEGGCCNGGTVGAWEFDPWAGNSTQNIYADMLVGHPSGYSMASQNFTDDMRYNEFAWFAQDQWRVHPRLTLNLGLRFEREGNWYPANENQGIMVWDPSLYNVKSSDPLTGFTWHGKTSSIPLSGWTTKPAFVDPRFGAAFDVFGNGLTVLRGGFGLYRYQIAYNNATANGMLDAPLGLKSFASNCTFTKLADLATCGAAAAGSRTGNSVGGMLRGDDKAPYTQTWNVIVDQRAFLGSTFELQYSGNRSRDLLIESNGNGGIPLSNINVVPVGAFFKPDPVTGTTYYCQGTPSSKCVPGSVPDSEVPHYRPYDYTAVNIYRHGSYSNYNGLVAQWMKHTGKAVFNLNYTWGHALGIRGGDNSNGQGTGASLDALTLRNNYGPLAFDRRHIINATYVFTLPSPIHGIPLVEQAVNGWTVTGVTQFQTGPPLQGLTSGNLNAGFPGGTDNKAVLGTDAIKLEPYLVCNPAVGLASGQYFNPSCFRAPNQRGVNGPLEWPNITGPGFMTSDLGLYKTFKVTEHQKIEFRTMAFNFLNHPNPQFGLGNDINLSFSAPGGPNTNTATTGKPKFKVGNRTLEFALKYIF